MVLTSRYSSPQLRKQIEITLTMLPLLIVLDPVLPSKDFPSLRQRSTKPVHTWKREDLESDADGFILLLKALLDAWFTHLAMDYFHPMNLWDSDPITR